jgi:malonate transporter
LDMLARASTPVALIVIGGTLVCLEVRKMVGDIAAISLGKLVIHPVLVAGLVMLLLPDDPLGRVGIVLAAAPMFSVYPIIGQRYGQEDLCAAALFVATAASFLTLNLLLWLI